MFVPRKLSRCRKVINALVLITRRLLKNAVFVSKKRKNRSAERLSTWGWEDG